MRKNVVLNNLKRLSIFIILNLLAKNAVALEIEKSPNDLRRFAYLKLENGLKLVVVSDPTSQHNACSLEVNAGSFNEPDRIPGLAHFVEHVLFLGTKNYPKPDEFKQLIDRNGGNYNAVTGNTYTRFYFTIHPLAFENSLSMFSSFFIDPLFNSDYLDREIKAVDAEYQMNIKSDGMKVLEVNKQTSNPKHPYHRFNVGNIETLSNKKYKLREEAINFFENHYAPSHMTLCLVGPQSTDYLLNSAKKFFSGIPDRTFSEETYPLAFDQKQRKIDIHVKTEISYNQMILTFVLPKFDHYQKEKPLVFVSNLLGSKDKSSLYHHLKEKNWINDLSINTETFLENEDLLSLSFSLTPEGFQHKDEVAAVFFEYIDFIKRSGYPKDFYDDLKAISALHWKYYQPEKPLSLAAKITENLHIYPPDKILSYDFKFDAPAFEFNQPLIKKIFDELTIKNMRRIILSSEVQGEKETPWYRASYTLKNLPEIGALEEDVKKNQLVFINPSKNEYIPENFVILEKDKSSERKTPERIIFNATEKLWFFHDDLFKEPRANIFINLATDLTTQSPKNVVLADLFSNLVVDSLKEEFYPAAFTGAYLSFYSHARGLGIKFYGYNDKQAYLVKKIFERFRGYEIDPIKFALAKDLILKNYKSFNQNALHEQTILCLHSLINNQNYHIDQLLSVLEQVTLQDLQLFVKNIRNEFSVEMLINGNHSIADAKNILQFVNTESSKAKKVLPLHTVKLPRDKIYFKLLKSNRDNHVLNWYLQNSEESDVMTARTIILERLISNAFFTNLRTKQQLGYAVYTQAYINNKVSGLIFCIESAHEPKVLFDKIKEFLQNYREEIIKLSANDLEQVKAAIITNLLQSPKTLSEQSDELFWPIQTGTLDFDYKQKAVKAIKSVTTKDIVKLYEMIESGKMGQIVIATKNPIDSENIVVLNNWHELKDSLS